MRSATRSAEGLFIVSTVRPSARNTTVSAYAAAVGSCVTITTVCSSPSTASRKSARIALPVRVSSAPVGSSAKITSGWATSARAIATRCCWPPESSPGLCVIRSARPTRSVTSASHALSGFCFASRSGSVMFWAAVSDGTRLNDWKTKPIRSRRNTLSCSSFRLARSTSASWIDPEVGRSRPAAQWRNVLLPEPDGPITAVNEPFGKASESSRRAATLLWPLPYTLLTDESRTVSGACWEMRCVSSTIVVMASFRCSGMRSHRPEPVRPLSGGGCA